ncbi:dockerin type I repeat-containing protein [Candidatus Sumerlaeota bacterium]|nr:dockerin type I repeat-containing protein [Candidatus Sumerlaeota bacterium]
MKKFLFSFCIAFILINAWGAAQDSIPYQTGFEASQGFVAGNSLNGQGGWTVEPSGGDAKITDTIAMDGSQSVELEANSQIDKQLAADPTDTIIWMEGYFRGAGTTAEPQFPDAEQGFPASAIVFFSATNGIRCYDGDGAGEGSWIDTNVSTLDEGTWYKISIRQDYTAQTWRCYIDNTKSPDQELGFRDDTVTTLNGFRNFADTISYLDTFRVIPGKKGDANLDNKVDAADLITLLNDPDGSGFDLIEKDNADMDDSGAIDSTDFNAFIDKILNRTT